MITSNSIENGSSSWILTDVVGSSISFYLELWNDKGDSYTQKYRANVIRIIKDPLNRHETKCVVKINNDEYGIPLSEIREYHVKNNEQLE